MNRIFSMIPLALLLMTGISAYMPMDKEAPSYPYVQSAEGGRYYFKMLPDASRDPFEHMGSGTIYEVRGKGKDRKLWSVNGWYAFRTFLSHDGEYLVRIGNSPRGSAPSETDLAIAFYRRGSGGNGIALKSYSTKDLIVDLSKVRPTVSHYAFIGGNVGFAEPYSTEFELVTIDGIRYRFDVQTGEIIAKEKVG